MMYIEHMTLIERLRERLRAFLSAESNSLLHILRSYVVHMGTNDLHDVDAAAAELLNEIIVEALTRRQNVLILFTFSSSLLVKVDGTTILLRRMSTWYCARNCWRMQLFYKKQLGKPLPLQTEGDKQ
ncbi:MAG: hypothetical protein KF726_25910 [Anaerolineae bacterium]|nr:hypothetical protein [Anaerolineae bacterium]